jgi:hypothetical protein
MGKSLEIKFFNTFLLKKVINTPPAPLPVGYSYPPVWAGSRGIPEAIGGYPRPNLVTGLSLAEWYVEEARIQGGYNETIADLGVKAYIVEEDTGASIRSSSLIYSGVYNSRTGINNTNQFSVAEDITKSLNPSNGSIQKLYAEDTNLIVFQEDKVSRALIDKDAIYSAEGGGTLTSSSVVIGDIQAYAGNYGISKDPQSFAVYGYRKYFTDKYRNAVLRLSQDGITEISQYGMIDFFRDAFGSMDSGNFGPGTVIGGWDMHDKQYVVSLQQNSLNPNAFYSTLTFDELASGFTSFFTFRPTQVFSIRSDVYSLNAGTLWKHYSPNVNYANFYGVDYDSQIQLVLNSDVSTVKTFKTLNYEGSTGWESTAFYTDTDSSAPIAPAASLITLAAIENQLFTNTFKKKEDKYFANLLNITAPSLGEVVWGGSITGLKGFYATATMRYSNTAVPKRKGDLFAVSSEYIESSY